MRVVFYMGFHFTHVIHVHIERCIISVQYLFDCQTAHFTFQQINLIIPTLFFWCCILLCSVWARCSLGTYCLYHYIIHSSCCPRIDEQKGTMLLFIILQFSLQVYLFGLLSWVTDDEYNWLWWQFFYFLFPGWRVCSWKQQSVSFVLLFYMHIILSSCNENLSLYGWLGTSPVSLNLHNLTTHRIENVMDTNINLQYLCQKHVASRSLGRHSPL